MLVISNVATARTSEIIFYTLNVVKYVSVEIKHGNGSFIEIWGSHEDSCKEEFSPGPETSDIAGASKTVPWRAPQN
jgi:hypothetical protein